MKSLGIRQAASSGYLNMIAAVVIGSVPLAAIAQEKPKPAAKPPAAKPAAAPGRGGAASPGRGGAAAGAGRGTTATSPGRGGATAGRGGATAGRGGTTPGRGGTTAGRGGESHPGARGAEAHPGGRGAEAHSGERSGVSAEHRPGNMRPGESMSHGAHGEEIRRGPHGEVRDVHARGMDIHHGPGGERTIVRERADHSRLVSDRYGHGYVERPYAYRGATFVNRTYYVGGSPYVRVYQPYVWGGVSMNVYAPGYFYAPAFYGYAYNPWAAPITFGWGWAGNPWYAYYGGYFTPYPAYASPALWLTDYYVSQTLQAAYVERQAELANAQASFTPMAPDVKQQISDEVRRQIALENAEARAGGQAPPDPGSSGIARMLTDNASHVFVVSAGLNLQSNLGDCAVSQGDVLRLNPGTPQNASTANLMVLATKGQDCQQGASVVVGVADLQDMQNHMREMVDQGLAELQKKQGQNGIPAAPAAATAQPTQTAYAAIAPPPDPNVGAELSAQTKEADQAEQDALQGSNPGGPSASPSPEPVSPAAAPASKTPLTIGQTVEEVTGILGQPVNVVDLGSKKIYVFKDLKVTFTNGKASSFQ